MPDDHDALLRDWQKNAAREQEANYRFLRSLKVVRNPDQIDSLAGELHEDAFARIDCTRCANCCKTMSPTFTKTDIKRISKHFSQTPEEFTKKWLRKDRQGDMLNKVEPCQFLDLKTNKCGIYEIRPADCAGFPHLPKRKMVDYMHVHKQNIEYCPATYKMVEKMQKLMEA